MDDTQPNDNDSVNIISWNVRGSTDQNSIIRTIIIDYLNPDIVCTPDTHLQKDESVKMEGYECFYITELYRIRMLLKYFEG